MANLQQVSSAADSAPLPVHVVVIASEQVLPGLQFIMHLANHYRQRFKFVGIYHTSDLKRSKAPAQRMKVLLDEWARRNRLDFAVELHEGGMLPVDVRAGVAAWFARSPRSRWLVNVTNGTKPMSTAATEITLWANESERRVMYLEIGSGWFEYMDQGDGWIDMQPLAGAGDPELPAGDVIDRQLTLTEVILAQYPAPVSVNSKPLPVLDIVAIANAALAAHWNWPAAFRAAAGTVPVKNGGDAFEMFIGSGLALFGLNLIEQSVELVDAGKKLAEMDLVLCRNNRLFCIDMKLPGADDEAKGVQLAKVASDARQIGGIGATAIAMRPGWPAEATSTKQAKDLGVRLLTQDDAERTFTALMQLIDPGVDVPAPVAKVEKLLASQKTLTGNSVLSHMGKLHAHSDGEKIHLDTTVGQTALHLQRPWVLVSGSGGPLMLHVVQDSPFLKPGLDWKAIAGDLQIELSGLLKGLMNCRCMEERHRRLVFALTPQDSKLDDATARINAKVREVLGPHMR